VAFTSAVSALPASGGTIFVPPGTYLLKNWTISKSGVRVFGAGSGYYTATGIAATILQAPNGTVATDDVVRISGVGTFGVTIEYLAVNPVAPNGSDRANSSIATNATGWRVNHCQILNGTNWAVDNKVAG